MVKLKMPLLPVGFQHTVLIIAIFWAAACNNNQPLNKYRALYAQDSILLIQTRQDDSALKDYMSSFDRIQENLEQIKNREEIITLNDESKANYAPMIDIKAIDNLILRNHRELNGLQMRIRNDSQIAKGFTALIMHLSHEQKDRIMEMNALQNKLAKANAAYQEIAKQFNDSMQVIQGQNKTITTLTNNINVVYYIIGTLKTLEEKNIIESSGGFAGIGKSVILKPGIDARAFTKADLTKLKCIPIGNKIKKIVSVHPPDSYKVSGNENSDTLYIINSTSFWSECKFLVVAVK